MSAIKYNIGDKVLIKDIDWYNENKNKLGDILVAYKLFSHGVYTWEHARFTKNMSKYCGQILTISEYSSMGYKMQECIDSGEDFDIWTDEMIEKRVEEENIEFTEEDKYWCDIMSESDPTTYVLPEGYQFVDEGGNIISATKIILEKKKKEYPKTYEECCKILGIDTQFCMKYLPHGTLSYKDTLIYNLQALIICRDAYWKIAGEEMGLGKPWEPDWSTEYERKYVIEVYRNNVRTNSQDYSNTKLAFPTPEMRDSFKNNFDPDIEFCKEFL